MVATTMANCVAQGIDFLGKPMEKGKVIYFDNDNYDFETKSRIISLNLSGTNEILYEFNDSKSIYDINERLNQIEDIEITSSWFNNVEIMHKGVNKGEALKALINYLGIDKDEVIAFGDNYNDLPMLELAGIGVVMGNANDEVKEKGDYITAKNTEDGVAKAIYKFLKI